MSNDQGLGFTLSRRAELNPDATALIFREEQWTYAQLNQLTNKLAHGLHALGVNPGDRVGFLGLNHPRFLFALFAAAKLNAIFVPLNFRLTGPELSFIISDAGMHTLVYEEAFASIVELDPWRPERAGIRLRRRAERRAWLQLTAARSARHRARLPGCDERRCADHVHLGDDRPSEGRDAHPRQRHLEQHQRVAR